MNIDNISPTDSSNTSSRRTFILAASAVVAGATLLRRDLPASNGGLASLAASKGPRIGVAYIEDSAGATSLSSMLAAGRVRAVPASTLGSGDLSNQIAAMTVHGFSPGIGCDGTCPYTNVFVDAHIPSPDPLSKQATIPFYAWTFRRSPAMASGRSRFVVGAGRGHRVGFSIETTSSASTPGASTATTVFTSGRVNITGQPQLRRGIYLLGLNDGAWSDSVSLPAIDDPKWAELASIVVSVDSA
jgi:hypothetical protein